METKRLLISATYGDNVGNLLRPDDMFISGGDLASAGMLIGSNPFSAAHFASCLASLSHILTRIVLSERLVFVYSPGGGAEEPPTSYILPSIESFCGTLQIDDRHPLIAPVIVDAFDRPVDLFGDELVQSVNERLHRVKSWVPDDYLFTGELAEYAVANLVSAPYAPNSFVSEPFARHALKGRTTADELLDYVEDLRRETSKAMNLHHKLNIYDLKVPVILAAVLRESKDPSDLIRIASQMNADANVFRTWCRDLDSLQNKNPEKYLARIRDAQDSLRRLGRSVGTQEHERMQVSASAGFLGFKLPAPTLSKIVDFLNVDVRFLRSRSFLLNLLSTARQLQRLAPEIARVFSVREDYANAAAHKLTKLAEAPDEHDASPANG